MKTQAKLVFWVLTLAVTLGVLASCSHEKTEKRDENSILSFWQFFDHAIEAYISVHPDGLESELYLTPTAVAALRGTNSEFALVVEGNSDLEIASERRPFSDSQAIKYSNVRLCIRSKADASKGIFPNFWIVFKLRGRYMVISEDNPRPRPTDQFLAEMRDRRLKWTQAGKLDMDDEQFAYLEKVVRGN